MKLEILEIARREFDEAKEFDEMGQPGLGARFEEKIRRYILPKFPFKVPYSIQSDTILVLAFAHVHRMPGYWAARAKT